MMRGSFHRVEHILIGLATVFVAYIAAGFLGGPDWAQALHGLVVPAMPLTRDAVLIATATASVAAEPVRMSCLPVAWSMPPKIRTWNRAPRRRMPVRSAGLRFRVVMAGTLATQVWTVHGTANG